jgi:hypothetical protein
MGQGTGKVRPNVLVAIPLAGLVVGILDGLEALVFFMWLGVRGASVFQYIAGALLGPGALKGGGKTLAIGILLHFCVALAITTVYVLAAYVIPALVRYALVTGPLYGIVAYFMMTFVVVPFFVANAGGMPRTAVFVNGVVGHALLVGLPIALITRWSASRPT